MLRCVITALTLLVVLALGEAANALGVTPSLALAVGGLLGMFVMAGPELLHDWRARRTRSRKR